MYQLHYGGNKSPEETCEVQLFFQSEKVRVLLAAQ